MKIYNTVEIGYIGAGNNRGGVFRPTKGNLEGKKGKIEVSTVLPGRYFEGLKSGELAKLTSIMNDTSKTLIGLTSEAGLGTYYLPESSDDIQRISEHCKGLLGTFNGNDWFVLDIPRNEFLQQLAKIGTINDQGQNMDLPKELQEDLKSHPYTVQEQQGPLGLFSQKYNSSDAKNYANSAAHTNMQTPTKK